VTRKVERVAGFHSKYAKTCAIGSAIIAGQPSGQQKLSKRSCAIRFVVRANPSRCNICSPAAGRDASHRNTGLCTRAQTSVSTPPGPVSLLKSYGAHSRSQSACCGCRERAGRVATAAQGRCPQGGDPPHAYGCAMARMARARRSTVSAAFFRFSGSSAPKLSSRMIRSAPCSRARAM
jgi:hypothetical protein